ncbi:hypothetical protein OG785_22285 [Streptomyces sp. NBC_00006]|uniref:hypothetical protein n=1 Tax=unclassified Streptomyces TaxID=2593676 RepID=UPI00225941AF|nr:MULTISPECIES: hypothetical protein [unclassified Streptomyces]MCX4827312.1 hypothetical protein [Streptomyces sp. NBC_01016]MCX5533270.1 hypothetical protein [Streptomyces sp. NBC_00006]
MPRPTVAQLAYGSATVVCSTIAMVLLSQTESGPGVPVIAVSALILGLFVAMSVPTRKRDPEAGPGSAEERVPAQRLSTRVPSPSASAEASRAREPAGP